MPTTYPSLSIGAKTRLAIFKREAAKPDWRQPMTWRDVRFAKLTSPTGLARGYNTRGSSRDAIWYIHDEYAVPGRRVLDCGDVMRASDRFYARDIPTGWYTDNDQRETAIGIVIDLPHGKFLAGYRWDSNGEHVVYPEMYDDKIDAARAADAHAEVFAEMAREDDARFRVMADAEAHAEAVESDVREAIAERNEPRNSRHDPREWLRDRIAELRAAREDLETATSDYERGV